MNWFIDAGGLVYAVQLLVEEFSFYDNLLRKQHGYHAKVMAM